MPARTKKELADNLQKYLDTRDDLRGTIVDQYEGTYGIVFKIDQGENTFPRFVCYKTFNPESTAFEISRTQKIYNLFEYEGKKWHQFKKEGYPLVITPFFTARIDDTPFIAMPYCERTLRKHLRERGMLSEREAIALIIQIVDALIISIENGLESHQDLKPENILLSDLSQKFKFKEGYPEYLTWEAKISDFGLANAWRELRIPQGTVPYMAPEQFKEREDFSKVDVYAIGVILYEMLTGKHPSGEYVDDTEWDTKRFENWIFFRKPLPEYSQISSTQLKGLIDRCLSINMTERPTMREIFDILMGELKAKDELVHANLLLRLDYYHQLSDKA